jgi:adenylosuccinate lyase
MQETWSERRKLESWRRMWLALAESQHELGLPVSREQVEALRARLTLTDEDVRRAQEHERRLRHDVMAHVHALGDAVPIARGIIHLGATSQDINCNTEIPLIRQSLDLVCAKTSRVIDVLADFALKWKSLPCLGFTHFQPAQPTTVGKRAAMWASELALALINAEHAAGSLRLRGLKGATGTQASFLALFNGDESKVLELERRVAKKLGWDEGRLLTATGQTYPRVIDAIVLSALACIAASIHKIATDIRLLAGMQELDEPLEPEQVGSSAMPHKRNPMRCERISGLCRFVIAIPHNALTTASTQWLERTLDDSSNRRLAIPESFLALDGVLDLMHDVASGLIVHEGAVRRNLASEMPFLASETLMLAATRLGRDRQQVHEALRRHAQAAADRVKDSDGVNDLLDRFRAEPLLKGVNLDTELDPVRSVGLAAKQVERFVSETVQPLRTKYRGQWHRLGATSPRV